MKMFIGLVIFVVLRILSYQRPSKLFNTSLSERPDHEAKYTNSYY